MPRLFDAVSHTVVVRPERADHPQVAALLEALDVYLGSLYAPEANHILDVQALLAPDVHFVAAWQGSMAVGCGAVRIMPGEPDTAGEPYGEIKRMFVHPASRGQGIGDRLISALEDALKLRQVPQALLETGGEQHAALRLYERAGYARRGPFGGYPDNGLSVFYGKRLG